MVTNSTNRWIVPMAEKRVSVRLAAVGGDRSRRLEGWRGWRSGLRSLSREMEAANTRLRPSRGVSGSALPLQWPQLRLLAWPWSARPQTVDAQAKLAQSLGTTVASIQTLERAGELAGVSMSGIEQATKDLTAASARRLPGPVPLPTRSSGWDCPRPT